MSNGEKPALMPPPGEESNFSNPPNQNVKAHIGIIICLFLTFSSVIIRAYSRLFCMKVVRIQDVIALVAFGTYIGFVSDLYWYLSFCGYFVHQWNVPLKELPMSLHIVYIGMVLYEVTMMGLKISILTEWIHLFVPHGTRNPFYWTCLAIMIINVMYYTASILAVSLSCEPRAMLCERSSVIFIYSAVVNLISDLIILILPIRTTWQLHLSKRKKINISLVFAVGILCCASAAVRLSEAVISYKSPDKTFGISSVSLWCLAEATCAFLVFCMPTAPKAFKDSRLARTLFGSASAASQHKAGTGPTLDSHNRAVYGEHAPTSRNYMRAGVPLQNLHSSTKAAPDASESSEQLHVAH